MLHIHSLKDFLRFENGFSSISNLACYWSIVFFFAWATAFVFGEASQIMSFSLALFTNLQSRTTCLPHKDVGILLSVLSKDTTRKLAGLFSTIISLVLSAKLEGCEYHFLKSFGVTRLGEMNSRSIECEADALTTTLLRPVEAIATIMWDNRCNLMSLQMIPALFT